MKIITLNKRYSILDVTPDELAAQFTLIDLPIFKSINRDELLNLGKSARKQDLSPNVVAMNRQFNQVTFWVVGQILLHESPRSRAELISHFIKTAKRLYQLNNLYSSYAVVSALLSSPIYRLEKTWYFVRKKYPKEKQQFDQLQLFYSDNNNYEMLRNHLAICSLPCIPYLGMYLRDIIYINEAHQEGTIQRTKNINKILGTIEKFQLSQYDQLVCKPSINLCLISGRYIDELQKFVEDENYRRSLELEPSEVLVDQQLECNSPSSNNNNNSHQQLQVSNTRQKKSAMLFASLTSLVQSAVINTSNKFGATTPRRTSAEFASKHQKYLIDDSLIDHTNFPPPICTSN